MVRKITVAGLSLILVTLCGARHHRQTAPTADNITISVAPGDTVAIPFSGFDADADLFGFFPTSAPTPAEGGTFFSLCFCGLSFPGGTPICACSSTFTASPTFSGTVTFTYRAVDTTGLESADATVTIKVAFGFGLFLEPLSEIRHLISRALIGERIKPQLAKSLLAKVSEAEALWNKGQLDAADHVNSAFMNEVEAKSGKGIDPVLAEALLVQAQRTDKDNLEQGMRDRTVAWKKVVQDHFDKFGGIDVDKRKKVIDETLNGWVTVLRQPEVFEGNKHAIPEAAEEEFGPAAHGSQPDLTGYAGHIKLKVNAVEGELQKRQLFKVPHEIWDVKELTVNITDDGGGTREVDTRLNGLQNFPPRAVAGNDYVFNTRLGKVAPGSILKVNVTVRLPSGVTTTKTRAIYLTPTE